MIEHLRQMRLRAGYRQRDVARYLGVTTAEISHLELGQRRLDVLQAVRYCQAIGESFVEFAAELERVVGPSEPAPLPNPPNRRKPAAGRTN